MAAAFVDRGVSVIKGIVITVHGLYGGSLPLLPVRSCIQMRNSFKVEAFSYQPQNQNLLESGKLLAQFLKERKPHVESDTIQFVTYGYGALVLRESFRHVDWSPTKSKLVMIAPPNRGMKYYRSMKRNIGIAGYGGIAAEELASWTEDDLDQRLGKLPNRCCPLVLAGSLCLNPFNQHNYPNDGLVMVDETTLPGEFRHQVITATHYSLAFHPSTIMLTTSFLEA